MASLRLPFVPSSLSSHSTSTWREPKSSHFELQHNNIRKYDIFFFANARSSTETSKNGTPLCVWYVCEIPALCAKSHTHAASFVELCSDACGCLYPTANGVPRSVMQTAMHRECVFFVCSLWPLLSIRREYFVRFRCYTFGLIVKPERKSKDLEGKTFISLLPIQFSR